MLEMMIHYAGSEIPPPEKSKSIVTISTPQLEYSPVPLHFYTSRRIHGVVE